MTFPKDPGNNVGVARGSITIGLDQLQKQRTVAIRSAQEIGKGFKQSFDSANKSVENLNSGLGALPQSALALKSRFREIRNEGQSLAQNLDNTTNSISRLGSKLKGLPQGGVELGALPSSALGVRSRFSGLNEQINATKRQFGEVEKSAQATQQQIGRTFTASVSVVNTFNQRLESTTARLKQVQGELTTISTIGGGVTFFGLRAADNLRNLQIRFRELAGDQAAGLALMEQIGDAAQRLNLPVRETQESFAGLVPAIRDAGGEIDTYVNRIARLATLNRQEGVAGAVFAVREALTSGGTDLVSLAERFNLPRRRLRELTEETGDFAAALDIVLNEQGATNEALEGFSNNLNTATTRLRDAATRGLEKAFNSQLDGTIGLINNAANAIDRLPDGVLEFAGGAITATTAAAGFALTLTQILDTYTKLKAAGAFAPGGVGRTVAAAGILGGGLASAPTVGTKIANFIGDVTGNEGQANRTVDETNQLVGLGFEAFKSIMRAGIEALRQALVIGAVGVLEGGRGLAKAIVNIASPLFTFPGQIERFKAQFEVATGQLLVSIGNLITGIGNFLPGSGLSDQGSQLIAIGEARVAEGQARIDTATEAINQVTNSALQSVDAMFDTFITGTLLATGAIATGADETSATAKSQFDQTRTVAAKTIGVVKENVEDLARVMRERLQDIEKAIQFRAELHRLEREGTVDQIDSRISGLEDERAAIQALLPELEALAGKNDEAAASLRNYGRRLTEIDSQIEQLGNIAPNIAQRQLNDLTAKFTEDIQKIEQERGKALTDLATKVRDDLNKLDQDIASEFTDARQEEIEAVQEYQDERREIEEEHQARLLEIQRSGQESIIDAAGKLDAAGVRAAIRAREKQEEEAEKRFEEENERNAERLADVRENLDEERREILNNYAQRRADILAAGNAERATIQQKYQQDITARTQAYNAEAQILQQYTNQRLNQQRSALNAELSSQQSAYSAMVAGAAAFANSMRGIAASIGTLAQKTTQVAVDSGPRASTTSSLSGGSAFTSTSSLSGASSRTGSVQLLSSSARSSSLTGSSAVLPAKRFADGGVARFGGSGEALAYVRNKERVLTPQQTASFDNLVAMLGGMMSGNRSAPNLDNLSVDVTGVDSFEALVERVTMEVVGKIYRSQIAGTP